MGRPSSLTEPAERLVLKVLRRGKKPLSAYELLKRLKRYGIHSSPIVYRALDLLMQCGTVHRVKELNSFIACDCEPDHKHAITVLTVCSKCKAVDEIHDHKVIHDIEKVRERGVPLVADGVVEIPILCGSCA